MSKPAQSLMRLKQENKSIPKNRAMVVKKKKGKKPKKTYMGAKKKKVNMLPRVPVKKM